MHPIQQWAGQTLPATSVSSASTTTPTLAQQGYTADQGAEIGMAVSVVPLLGALLGAIGLSLLSPSDAIPRWIWALIGGGVGLAVGNSLGLAAVAQIQPTNLNAQQIAANTASSSSFNELAFYQQLGGTLSSQLASIMSSSTAPATTTPVTQTPSTVPASYSSTS